MKRLLIRVAETLVAWSLIYLALWVLTGKWAFNVSDDKWRLILFILLVSITRTSAYVYGRWEIKHDATVA